MEFRESAMTRKVSGKSLFAGVIGLAMLGGVFAAGVQEVQNVRLALAGAANAWPAGACQQVNTFDRENGAGGPDLVCWTSDFALTVPEPGVR
jgi:hypothetical protein